MEDDLLKIPGVGKNIAQDLRNIGIHTIEDVYKRQVLGQQKPGGVFSHIMKSDCQVLR